MTDPIPPENAPKTVLTVTASDGGEDWEEVYDSLAHAWLYKKALCFWSRDGAVHHIPISRVVLWKVEAA